MRTGEKRIHYFRILRQLSTIDKRKKMSQKGEKRVYDVCPAATFSLRIFVTIYSYALSGNVEKGEKWIHYFRILRQLSTIDKRKKMSQKGEKRVCDICPAATFPLRIFVTIYSYALSGNVAPQWEVRMVFRKSAFFLKHLIQTR